MAPLVLSELQIEAMKEVGNIGAGHAATALSVMLNEVVRISTPSVEILPFAELARRLDRPGRTVSAVHMHVHGETPCQIVVLFEEHQALSFKNIFVSRGRGGLVAPALVDSTIKEVGSIIGGAYLTALTALTGIRLIASVPTLWTGSAQGALRALLDVPPEQDVFYVQTGFHQGRPVISGEFILIPEAASIGSLLSVFTS